MTLRARRLPERIPGAKARTRARSWALVLEGLETRGLMSVAVSGLGGGTGPEYRSRVAAEVSTSPAARLADRTITTTGVLDSEAIAARTPNSTDSANSATRQPSSAVDVLRRATPPRVTPRGTLENLVLPVRHEEPTTAGDPTANGGAAGPAVESAAAPEVVGAIGTAAMRLGGSASVVWAGLPDRAAGSDARAASGSGSPGTTVAAAGYTAGPGEMSSAVGEGGRTFNTAGAIRLPGLADPGSSREANSPALVEVIDGALHPDWEAVDREFRQFLAGTGDALGAGAAGTGGHAWLARIIALAAAIAIERAVAGRRRRPWSRFGLAALAGHAAGRREVIGPWPLSPS